MNRPRPALRPLLLLPLLVFASLATAPLAAQEAPGTATAPRLLDEVMVAVNTGAITRSEVIQETRCLLAEKGQSPSGRLPATLLNSVLDTLISKELLYQEMERLGRAEQNPEGFDAARDLRAFAAHLHGGDLKVFLESAGLSENGLLARLRRNAKIEAFMKERLELLSSVSEEELSAELAKRKAAGRPQTLSGQEDRELREFVRRDLQKRRYDEALVGWLASLEAQNRILRLSTFSNDEAPPVGASP